MFITCDQKSFIIFLLHWRNYENKYLIYIKVQSKNNLQYGSKQIIISIKQSIINLPDIKSQMNRNFSKRPSKYHICQDKSAKSAHKSVHKSSCGQRSWSNILKQITDVTNKVKMLCKQKQLIHPSNMKRKQSLGTKTIISNNHKTVNNSLRNIPIKSTIHDPQRSNKKKTIKNQFNAFATPNKKEKQRNQSKSNCVNEISYSYDKALLCQHSKSTCDLGPVEVKPFQMRHYDLPHQESYDEKILSEFKELHRKCELLEQVNSKLVDEKQILRQKLYRQSKQKRQLKKTIQQFKEKTKAEYFQLPNHLIKQQVHKPDVTSRQSKYNKENAQIMDLQSTSNFVVVKNQNKKNQVNIQHSNIHVNSKGLGTHPQSLFYSQFSDLFGPNNLDQNQESNKTQSMLIDISNRSSTSNKNNANISLQKELINALKLNQPQKNSGVKQQIKKQIMQIVGVLASQ